MAQATPFDAVKALQDVRAGLEGQPTFIAAQQQDERNRTLRDLMAAPAFAGSPGYTGGKSFGGGSAPSGNLQQIARKMLEERGWGAYWDAFDQLVKKESGWNPNAQNPTSTAYGLGQFLDSTWGNYGFKKSNDPTYQLNAMLTYIAARYGDPSRALQFHLSNNYY